MRVVMLADAMELHLPGRAPGRSSAAGAFLECGHHRTTRPSFATVLVSISESTALLFPGLPFD